MDVTSSYWDVSECISETGIFCFGLPWLHPLISFSSLQIARIVVIIKRRFIGENSRMSLGVFRHLLSDQELVNGCSQIPSLLRNSHTCNTVRRSPVVSPPRCSNIVARAHSHGSEISSTRRAALMLLGGIVGLQSGCHHAQAADDELSESVHLVLMATSSQNEAYVEQTHSQVDVYVAMLLRFLIRASCAIRSSMSQEGHFSRALFVF